MADTNVTEYIKEVEESEEEESFSTNQ